MSDATDLINKRATRFFLYPPNQLPNKSPITLMTAFAKQLVDECIEELNSENPGTWHREIENRIRTRFGLPLKTDQIQCAAIFHWDKLTTLRCQLKTDHPHRHFTSWSGGSGSMKWENDGDGQVADQVVEKAAP